MARRSGVLGCASLFYMAISSIIDPSRLESHGYGETRPLIPNNNNAARAQNRRVEFRIVEQ